jgi:hypothetical protein
VFENRVMTRIFGPKRNEVMRESAETYITRNTKIRIPHRGKIISRMRWGERVARMGEKKGACRVSVGKPEGKKSLGRPRSRGS